MTKRKSKKPPNWQLSYERYRKGMSLSVIAASSQRPIQVNTVVNHLLYALVDGREINLAKIWKQIPQAEWLLYQSTWNEIEQCCDFDLHDVSSWCTGTGVANFRLTTDCANRILENVDRGSLKSVMATEYKDRSVLDHERYSRWRNAVYR